MNILLIGNGAREHVIAETLMRSPKEPKLYAYMKANNPGITLLCNGVEIGNYTDMESIKRYAKSVKPDFVFIGPEDPLNHGVVDALEEEDIPCIGPKKLLARLETSKSFTRDLMKKHKIPGNPLFKVFTKENIGEAKGFLGAMDECVVKPDGLTGGKGVKVQGDHFQTKEEAIDYCEEVLKMHPFVLIEEKLDGEEFSLQCMTDGTTVVATPPVQDHKRAFENDEGPNTGGMGSYSCENHLLPFLHQEHVDAALSITQKMCVALKEEAGEAYKGVMYGGFILTKTGVKLIEYNARFGDPEAMNVLPLLKTDFVKICQAIIHGTLDKIDVEFDKQATVCKYVVPKGYPTNPLKGEKIEVSEETEARIYYAAVDRKEDDLIMSSSRAVALVGLGDTVEKAEFIAEDGCGLVKGKVFHRKDIGTKTLLQKRMDHMMALK